MSKAGSNRRNILASILIVLWYLSGFALEGRSCKAEGRRFDSTSSFILSGLRPPLKLRLAVTAHSRHRLLRRLSQLRGAYCPSAICLLPSFNSNMADDSSAFDTRVRQVGVAMWLN